MTRRAQPLDKMPDKLGARASKKGTTFSVFSAHAEKIEVCLFDKKDREVARYELPDRHDDIWSGFMPGVREGTRYGFRAHGPYEPANGHRFRPDKLLIDPYAKAMTGNVVDHPSLYETSREDNAPFVPKCIVAPSRAPFDWRGDVRPRTPISETIIYEAHVRGLTKRHPNVAKRLRGCYDALASPAIIKHLTELGITAIELLPVHTFTDEQRLLELGLKNYWGYNTLAFFAPSRRYFGPAEGDGLKHAIKTLHGHGIEVLLDVVYNHTAEGGAEGPILSFKGLDNKSYYRLDGGDYINDTGCGNTVNAANPAVKRLISDSLRYWVDDFHVDGFRFDLAPALTRNEDGSFEGFESIFDTLIKDPLFADVKLIAEPWDIGPGGYRLGQFSNRIVEWNDQFRDDVRRFWIKAENSAGEYATRMMGSADVFDNAGRAPSSSVNFVTAHDGFVLQDVVNYAEKHNEANGEENRDGHNDNNSQNFGIEGPSDDEAVRAKRALFRRNLMTSVMISQGTPMILAGDEIGHSQMGNNNAFCQDNEISWLNWQDTDSDFLSFVQRLSRLRHAHPLLRQTMFLHGEQRASDNLPNVAWSSFDGAEVDWHDTTLRRFCLRLRPNDPADVELLVAVNGEDVVACIDLPQLAPGAGWQCAIDTGRPEVDGLVASEDHYDALGNSITVFQAHTGQPA